MHAQAEGDAPLYRERDDRMDVPARCARRRAAADIKTSQSVTAINSHLCARSLRPIAP